MAPIGGFLPFFHAHHTYYIYYTPLYGPIAYMFHVEHPYIYGPYDVPRGTYID